MDKKSDKRKLGSHAAMIRDRPHVVASLTHPIRTGETVTVYRVALLCRPFVEGRAMILGPIKHTADLYHVQFENERGSHRRLVHPGVWQSEPDRLLAAFTAHWRAAISPDLLVEFPAYGDGPD